jgi:hypothetical protein
MEEMEKVVLTNKKEQKENEIVTDILNVLVGRQVTISEAISIIEATKDKILKTRINLLHNSCFINAGSSQCNYLGCKNIATTLTTDEQGVTYPVCIKHTDLSSVTKKGLIKRTN